MTEQDLFIAARRLSSPERTAYLAEACGADTTLRERVERLLSADAEPDSLLDRGLPSGLRHSALFTTPNPHTTAVHALPRSPQLTLPTDNPGVLGRLGHFDLLEVIGHGGFGVVYRALDTVLLRTVAVKVLHPQLALHPASRKRFLREARAAAAVRHTNVVPVFAVEEEPQPFLVMEYIAGQTLQQRLDRGGRLSEPQAVAIVRQVAAGLGAAHAAGLVHRDVKPANILIEVSTGRALVTDFGQVWVGDDSELSQQGMAAGTPMYMSPEQTRGERPDHRGDLFSLGGVLYATLTGRPPFSAPHPLAVMRRVAEGEPDPLPDVSPWLAAVVGMLLAKAPAQRFASTDEMIAALDDRGARVAASATPRPARSANRWAKRIVFVAVAAIIVLLVALPTRPDPGLPNEKPEVRTRTEVLSAVAPNPREVKHAPPPIDEPPLPADPDRFAAVWLMSRPGFAQIVYRHEGQQITLCNQDTTKPFNAADRSGDLPTGPLRLISVNVNRNRVITNDDVLVALRGLKHLTELQVSNCRTTDAMLTHFRHSTQLETAIFHSTGLTDEGLRQLEQFPALRNVRLRGTRVTDLGVRRLSRSLPKVVIDWNGGIVGPFEEGK